MKKILIFIIALVLFPNIVSAKVKIEDVQYETLDEAMEQIKEGETITLLSDLDLTDTTKYGSYHNWLFPENATLDLNGYTITTAENANGNPTSVWLGNHLTIKNGNFNSHSKDNKTDTYFEANYALFIGDEVETSHITLENINVSTGINIYNALNVTLKNVTAMGRKYYAIWLDQHVTATIEGGNYSSNGVAVVGITRVDNDDMKFDSELVINSGHFKVGNAYFSLSEKDSKRVDPIIKGGTYDVDVTKFVAEEHECILMDNTYIVKEKEYDRDIVIDTKLDEEMILGVNKEIFTKTILDTLNTTNEVNIERMNVKVLLNFEKIESNKEIFKDINKELPNATIDNYFDITIHVIDKQNNQKIGNLTKLTNQVKLTMQIPENHVLKDGYTRKYYILREHGGKVDVLDAILSEDKKSLTFETDLFSIYALAYEDTKIIDNDNKEFEDVDDTTSKNENASDNTEKIENPKTYDGIKIDMWIGFFSLIGLLIEGFYIKKSKIN